MEYTNLYNFKKYICIKEENDEEDLDDLIFADEDWYASER